MIMGVSFLCGIRYAEGLRVHRKNSGVLPLVMGCIFRTNLGFHVEGLSTEVGR